LEEFFASSAINQRPGNQGIPKYAILSHTCEFAQAHSSLVAAKDSAMKPTVVQCKDVDLATSNSE
jgi:hypothetical protein